MRKLVVISSVIPEESSAGEILLYRHLSALEGWTVTVVADPRKGTDLPIGTRLLKRLQRTRLGSYAADWDVVIDGIRWRAAIKSASLDMAGGIVLTVAHGDGCWEARRFAQRYRWPLVTVFHDWWPDIPEVHRPFRRILESRFHRLYRDSELALCISPGMKEMLGPHSNSVVLLPIPASQQNGSPQSTAPSVSDNTASVRVLYFGNLHDYGHELAELLRHIKGHPAVKLQIRGRATSWPAEFRDEMSSAGLWVDFAPRPEIENWLCSGEAFLIVMSFDPGMRRRMETSFPSKLTEAVYYGKPLVIWGPEYCSAVRWARANDRALCVTDRSPLAVLSAIERLAGSGVVRSKYENATREAALQDFCPDALQRQFELVLERVRQR